MVLFLASDWLKTKGSERVMGLGNIITQNKQINVLLTLMLPIFVHHKDVVCLCLLQNHRISIMKTDQIVP